MRLAPSFVIGPESQGRGYRLLAPESLDLPAARDLAMMLMEWSRTGEQAFVACLPLPPTMSDGACVLIRARRLGRESLGEAAYINGVLLDEAALALMDYRPERLLDKVPWPDGSLGFAARGLTLSTQDQGAVTPGSGDYGLAWRDRAVVVPDDQPREAVVRDILASIDPPEQRVRVRGWSTTDRLISRGRLNPIADCQLIVTGTRDAAQATGKVVVDWRGGPAHGGAEPESRRIWVAFHETILPQAAKAAPDAALKWSAGFAALSADAMAGQLLRHATTRLDVEHMSALIEACCRAGGTFAAAAHAVALDYVAALARVDGVGKVVPFLMRLSELTPEIATATLLALAPRVDALTHAQGMALIDFGCDLMMERDAGMNAEIRGALAMVIQSCLAADALSAEDSALVERVVSQWPQAQLGDLIDLTSPELLVKLSGHSRALFAFLARTILKPDLYAVLTSGGRSMGLMNTLNAIALMRRA